MSTPNAKPDGMPEAEVLSPEQIYLNIRDVLGKTEGVDTDILEILGDELLHVGLDDKIGAKQALEKLVALAAKRAEAGYASATS